jgi:hypothetical protein
MAISKPRARSVKHAVLAGDEQITDTLDGSNTTSTIELTGPASKVSIQSSDSLAGNVEYSCDGKTFFNTTAFTAGVPVSYSTHNGGVVKITRTSGSGKVVVLAI